MPLTTGTRLGPYEVVAPLGAGGMGEVYRASDPRLGRDVAIKALPAEFARDPDRVARFEREAKLLASLNHSNIGGIHGLEEVDGHRYLVLEFIEGETLDRRLARGPLPLGEALEVCRQIAAAVEAAHESGVVHRDLKPGNVMLAQSGSVKVLDFGLAKSAVPGASSDLGLSASPTMTYAATGVGVILGTAAYMSPEQARGKAVDKRTDIWSFGCVLYECLSGRRCFEGETMSDLIAQILQGEPDWNALPAKMPNRVRNLLQRCLDKDARHRLRDIGDARIELEEVIAQRSASTSIAAGAAAARPRSPVRRFATVAAVAVASAAVTLAAWTAFHRAPPRLPVRFEIPDAEGMNLEFEPSSVALAPDGKAIAFVAGDSTRTQLWVRPLETLAARPLAGTEGALMPFWSPDSRNIGFFTGTKLKRISAAGGDVEELTDVKRARGGTWNRGDVIVFAPTSDGPLYRIAAGGGEPRQITALDSTRHESGHRFPYFLPDGRHFVFSVLPPVDGKYEIDAGSIDSPKRERLMSASTGVLYGEPGYLLYQRNASIVAQPFDASRRRLTGAPVTLRENVLLTGMSGSPGMSASSNGSLAYRTLKVSNQRPVWTDLAGRELQQIPTEPGPYFDAQLSPDERRAALMRVTPGNESEIWICDLERGIVSRLSQEAGASYSPTWSPDGTRIAYLTSAGGPQRLVIRTVDGSAPEQVYLESDPLFKELYSWSPDGRYIVYGRQDPATRWDLWILPLDGDHTPRPYLTSPYSEQNAAVSWDGRWLAYRSDESGRAEVFVQSFPTPGSKYQVTNGGGAAAAWMPGDKQLGVASGSNPNTLSAADVIPGPEFRLGPLHKLCTISRDAVGWTVSRDGKRLFELLLAGKPPVTSIGVVMDWPAAMKRR